MKFSGPNKKKLQEAVDVFSNFRSMCELQFDLGYAVNVQFPSKHHINKILHIEYLTPEELEENYGEILTKKVFEFLPLCKNYVSFVRGWKHGALDPKK